jgi:hypothetical protein
MSHSVNKNIFIPFEEAGNHGIYDDRIKAEHNSDTDKILELKKLNNQILELNTKNNEITFKEEELRFRIKELSVKNLEYINKITSLELELDIIKDKKELEQIKIKYDIAKSNFDIKMLDIKIKHDYLKFHIEVNKDKIGIVKEMFKYKLDLKLMENKFNAEESNNIFKLSDFILKGASIMINQFK